MNNQEITGGPSKPLNSGDSASKRQFCTCMLLVPRGDEETNQKCSGCGKHISSSSEIVEPLTHPVITIDGSNNDEPCFSIDEISNGAFVDARNKAVQMFLALLQGQPIEISCFSSKMSVRMNIDAGFNGSVHENTNLHQDASTTATSSNNSNNTSFQSIFCGLFCSNLVDSIRNTGFLEEAEVEKIIKARVADLNKKNNNNNNNSSQDNEDGATDNAEVFTPAKIEAASKMIISNSHLFFLAAVSADEKRLFNPPIGRVFSNLNIFTDSRVAVIAHLLQGRTAWISNNHFLQTSSFDLGSLHTFCATLAQETNEPKTFVNCLKLLKLKEEFDGTIPKQLAVALIAKQFSTLSLKSRGENEGKFNDSIMWINKQLRSAAAIAESVNGSNEIHAVIVVPRQVSLREAISDSWKRRDTNAMFHHDFSTINNGFAMSLSNGASSVFQERHLRMHAVDATALEVPPASSKPESPVDERCIYIVPGSSGLGKTTSCVCYDPEAPRIYIDSGADMASLQRQNITTLTVALHRAIEIKQDAESLTADQIRGVRDGYASLLLLHAILRTFESTDKSFAGSCVVLPTCYLDKQNLDESIARISMYVGAELLQNTTDATAICRAIIKKHAFLERIRNALCLNAAFGGTLILILDEMGACPEVMRGFTSCWESCLRPLLKESLLMTESSKIVFLAAGTGSQRFANTIYGSRTLETGCLRFCTVHPNRVFRNCLFHFKKVCHIAARASLSSHLFDLIFEDEIAQYYPSGDDDSPNSSGMKRYKLRRNITAAQYRYVQMVIHNARCAAIAATIIDQAVGLDGQMKSLPIAGTIAWSEPMVASMLPMWSLAVASYFPKLNGLRSLNLRDRLICVGEALRISMTKQLNIAANVENDLCVNYGVMEDTARHINTADVDHAYHEVISTTNDMSLVCSRQMPRGRVSETAVSFFLTQFGGIAASVGSASCELLEQSAADYQLICLVLNCSQHLNEREANDAKRNEWIARLPPICRLYVTHDINITGAVYYRKLSTWLAEKSSEIPADDLTLWRKAVCAQNGAVVLINGSCAPFADIVVITKNVIFLTQTKYLSSESCCDAAGEFDKMHSDKDNSRTRELLMWCCGDTRDVTFVCIILTKKEKPDDYTCTCGTSATEGFNYEEHFVTAFEDTKMKRLPNEVGAANAQDNNNNNNNNNKNKTAINNVTPAKALKKLSQQKLLPPPRGPAKKAEAGTDDNKTKDKNTTTKTRLVSSMFPMMSSPASAINQAPPAATVESNYIQYYPVPHYYYYEPANNVTKSVNEGNNDDTQAGQRRERE